MIPLLAVAGIVIALPWVVKKSAEAAAPIFRDAIPHPFTVIHETKLSGENPMVGASFLSKLGKVKNLKSLKKMDWKNIKKTAKTVGPAVATVYPPAGAAIYGALALEKAAKGGDKKAIAKIALTKAAAKSGNPKAKLAMDVLQTAENVKGHKKSVKLLAGAKKGDPKAIQKMAALAVGAKMGSPAAVRAIRRVQFAKSGLGYYKFLTKSKKSYY